MSPFNYRAVVPIFLAVSLLLGACSAPTKVDKTFAAPNATTSSFSNFLVIGVAGDYNSRALFERDMVAKLRNKGVSATPYHYLVKGNQPLVREQVIDVVKTNGFDAVLVTRVQGREVDSKTTRGPAALKVTHKQSGNLTFIRYDYEELNDLRKINLTATVVLATEVHSAASEEKVWGIEFSSSGSLENSVEELVDNAANTIIKSLVKDRLIRP
jgi:hypothetical protein